MKVWLSLSLLLAVLVIGCGSGSGDTSDPPGSSGDTNAPARSAVHANAAKDRKTGRDLANYFLRGCPTAAQMKKFMKQDRAPSLVRKVKGLSNLCGHISYIDVLNGQISVQTTLKRSAVTPALGDAFCSLIEGSDVADFQKGHALLDNKGNKAKICPARTN